MFEGFLWGTILTGIFSIAGLVLGIWLGRRSAIPAVKLPEAEKLEPLLAGLRNFTEGFSQDVSEYRALIEVAAKQAAINTTEQHSPVWEQITVANEHLKKRLEEAEASLASQSNELSRYMNEARTDVLTGLPNRRAFEEELSRREALRDRSGTQFAIVMIDIDRFKSFNDRFGHETGDHVLKHVARAVRTSIRSEDLAARLGGEEFAVVVTAATLEEAQFAAERLRLAVENSLFSHAGKTHSVTISCGTAMSQVSEGAEHILARADEALYAAKNAGRNRVFRHDGTLCRPFASCGEASPPTPESFREVCGELRKKLLEAPR